MILRIDVRARQMRSQVAMAGRSATGFGGGRLKMKTNFRYVEQEARNVFAFTRCWLRRV